MTAKVEAAPERAPASVGSLLSADVSVVKDTVKRMNAARGRSPAVEQPANIETQMMARYRNWIQKRGLRQREDLAKSYFGSSPVAEYLAMSLVLTTQAPINDEMRELQYWATTKFQEDASNSVTALNRALSKISVGDSGDRDWTISMLYGIAHKQEPHRRDVRSVLLREVNRQGIQTIEGMTTLVKILRIQHTQEWVNEVRQEFEAMNPGSDLSEFVALRE